jgi:hypothetical protein
MGDWLDDPSFSTPYQNYLGDAFDAPSYVDTNPFPMDQFRTSQLSSLMNPPQQQNSISDIMGQIGSGVNNDPALSRYFQLAQQGPPTREQYAPSTGRKILAAIGGIGSMFSDPAHAVQNTSAILDRPYDLAAGQYKNDLATAADAAKQENNLLNTGTSIYGHISQAENYRNLAGSRQGTLDLGNRRLDQTGDIARQKLTIQQQLVNEKAKYDAGVIGIGQLNAATRQAQLQLNQLQSGSLINERNSQADLNNARTAWGPISGNRSTGPTGGLGKPNAAVMNTELKSAIYSNSILTNPAKGFFLSDGSPNVPRILQDPEARVEWQRIMLHYGMVEQPPPFDMNNLFNVQGQP